MLPEWAPRDRTAAIGFYKQKLSDAEKKGPEFVAGVERHLALNDLFFLIVYVLHRADVNRDWLFDRCREVQNDPDGYLDLWSREHYKSTTLTFGLTIQDILNDPNVTIGIFSHTRPVAKSFLRQIKREFEDNKDLLRLFPDVVYADPQHQSQKWSEDDGIIVKRSANLKEATVEAWGLVDGQPTGKHFKTLLYDDVVTQASVTTPEMIKKTTDAWSLSLNLGSDGGTRRIIGTYYHFNDSYHEMQARGAVKVRFHPATDNGTWDGEPVLWTRETLMAKRREMGPYVSNCQLLLDPVADQAQGFEKDWLQYWPARNTPGLNLYILVDPANSKRTYADYTSMWVVGLGEDDVFRVATIVRDRLNLTERADLLFALHRQYRPLGVGYEEYGMQGDIQHIQDRMKRENYRFTITPVGGRMSKPDRIRRLIPLFEQGRMLLPECCWRVNREKVNEDLTAVFVNQEYLPFPVSHHDDMLDSLSRLFDIKTARPQKRQGKGPSILTPSSWGKTTGFAPW